MPPHITLVPLLQFFLGQPEAKFDWGAIQPQTILSLPRVVNEARLKHEGQEMVIMVGRPAAGKSTISKRFFHEKMGYELINQDTLKTPAKCVQVCVERGW